MVHCITLKPDMKTIKKQIKSILKYSYMYYTVMCLT